MPCCAQGGNAVDAGIFAACAGAPGRASIRRCAGIAGFGELPASTHARQEFPRPNIDAHAPAPLAARPDMWANLIEGEARDGYGFFLKGRVNDIGYRSICAPANLKMYHEAHKEHGSLPWSRIVEPAIHWAENGWTVRPHGPFLVGRRRRLRPRTQLRAHRLRTGGARSLLPARRHAKACGRRCDEP